MISVHSAMAPFNARLKGARRLTVPVHAGKLPGDRKRQIQPRSASNVVSNSSRSCEECSVPRNAPAHTITRRKRKGVRPLPASSRIARTREFCIPRVLSIRTVRTTTPPPSVTEFARRPLMPRYTPRVEPVEYLCPSCGPRGPRTDDQLRVHYIIESTTASGLHEDLRSLHSVRNHLPTEEE